MRDDDELTDDALAGPYRVWQRRRGHRYSLDDVATAWVAARAAPGAELALDLGAGLGSVLLMLAYKLPRAWLWGVEAQDESFALLERNCARNRVRSRVRLLRADLRGPACAQQLLGEAAARGARGFALVTGTPPYQPPGRGSVSPDPQRAHARVELRGGVEAYLQAGGELLAADGVMVVCADARAPERVEQGARTAGLWPCSRLDVVPSAHKPALFSVFTLRRAGAAGAGVLRHEPPLFARDAHGARTEQALALRRFFDLPVAADEAPSPRRRARGRQAGGGAREAG